MKPEEKLQLLLQLKRQEQPPEGYFENFLEEFHVRQRRDLMKQSLLSQIGERISDFFSAVTRPRVLIPAAACYMGVMLLLLVWPHRQNVGQTVVVASPVLTVPGVNPGNPGNPGIPGNVQMRPDAQLTSLPPAPQAGRLQAVSAAPMSNTPPRLRTTNAQGLQDLVGEAVSEPVPQPKPKTQAQKLENTGKLREF